MTVLMPHICPLKLLVSQAKNHSCERTVPFLINKITKVQHLRLPFCGEGINKNMPDFLLGVLPSLWEFSHVTYCCHQIHFNVLLQKALGWLPLGRLVKAKTSKSFKIWKNNNKKLNGFIKYEFLILIKLISSQRSQALVLLHLLFCN